MKQAEILAEEQTYRFETFNAEIALKIGNYIANKAIKHNMRIGVDIYVNGRTLFHFLSDQCSPDNDQWLKRKKNMVLYFQHSTKFMVEKLKGNSSLLSTKYGLKEQEYALIEGGFPIITEFGVIGAICVSGLLPEEDHQMVIEAIQHIK
ncbi:MAG: heme-binding protein [Erysipelotrichaceae bacterium]